MVHAGRRLRIVVGQAMARNHYSTICRNHCSEVAPNSGWEKEKIGSDLKEFLSSAVPPLGPARHLLQHPGSVSIVSTHVTGALAGDCTYT